MTVQELMDILNKMHPSTEVFVWNPEWDSKDSINEIEVDQDGDVVIL